MAQSPRSSQNLNPSGKQTTGPNSPLFGAHQALGRRETLEDRLRAAELTTAGGLTLTLAMIADGVGGAAFGERASELAVETAFQTVITSPAADPRIIPFLLRQALEQAQAAILAEQRADKAKREMGTTAVLVAIHGNALYLANVGDSRAYLLRDGKLHQITRDHSWGLEMLRQGLLRDAEEADRHPKSGELYRSLGEAENFKVDLGIYLNGVIQEEAAAANQGLPLGPNDRLLLCSDGLVRERLNGGGHYVEDEEIVRVLSARAPADAAVDLIDLAVKRRADDNVSAVVLEMPGSKRVFALPPWSRYAALGAGALLLLAALLFFLLRGGGGSAQQAGLATAEVLPTLPPSTMAPPAALSGESAGGMAVSLFSNGVETGTGWTLPNDGSPVVVLSGPGSMQLRYPDGSELYLAPDTEVALAQDDGRYRVEIVRGTVVFSTTGAEATISNRIGSWVRIVGPGAIAGVSSLSEPVIEFSAHCLAGAGCQLKGDLDNIPLPLRAGEAGLVGGSGRPELSGSADFNRFAALAPIVPTATATATLEATPTPTETPTPTNAPTRKTGSGVPTVAVSTNTSVPIIPIIITTPEPPGGGGQESGPAKPTTAASATAVPPTAVPPTAVPPTAVPPTAVPPTAVPPTAVPPPTATRPSAGPSPTPEPTFEG